VADRREETEIERVIDAAVAKHAKRDVRLLARGTIAELRAAALEGPRQKSEMMRGVFWRSL
jgi:hypothetical protein